MIKDVDFNELTPLAWRGFYCLSTVGNSLRSRPLPLTLPMDSTQKLIEKLVERRMQNTGESQVVATVNVMAAMEKLKTDKTP